MDCEAEGACVQPLRKEPHPGLGCGPAWQCLRIATSADLFWRLGQPGSRQPLLGHVQHETSYLSRRGTGPETLRKGSERVSATISRVLSLRSIAVRAPFRSLATAATTRCDSSSGPWRWQSPSASAFIAARSDRLAFTGTHGSGMRQAQYVPPRLTSRTPTTHLTHC